MVDLNVGHLQTSIDIFGAWRQRKAISARPPDFGTSFTFVTTLEDDFTTNLIIAFFDFLFVGVRSQIESIAAWKAVVFVGEIMAINLAVAMSC